MSTAKNVHCRYIFYTFKNDDAVIMNKVGRGDAAAHYMWLI